MPTCTNLYTVAERGTRGHAVRGLPPTTCTMVATYAATLAFASDITEAAEGGDRTSFLLPALRIHERQAHLKRVLDYKA